MSSRFACRQRHRLPPQDITVDGPLDILCQRFLPIGPIRRGRREFLPQRKGHPRRASSRIDARTESLRDRLIPPSDLRGGGVALLIPGPKCLQRLTNRMTRRHPQRDADARPLGRAPQSLRRSHGPHGGAVPADHAVGRPERRNIRSYFPPHGGTDIVLGLLHRFFTVVGFSQLMISVRTCTVTSSK